MTIRVLHVALWAKTFPRFRMPLLEAQRSKQFEVEVACLEEKPFSDEIRERGFIVNAMPMPPDYHYFHLTANIRSVLWLAQLIRERRFHVVHIHQAMGFVLGVMATRLARPPLVIYTTAGLKSLDNRRFPLNYLYSAAERVLLSWTDAVFSVNRTDDALMIEKWGFPASKVFYVGPSGGCGIDIQRFDHRMRDPEAASHLKASLGLPPDGKVVGIVSRLVWYKGYNELLRAAQDLLRLHADLSFLVVGEGSHGPEIEALAQKLGIAERVIFTGRRSDVPQLLAIMDVFALPSYREGFNVAALEAMAMGLPVVGTRVRGLMEPVVDGKTGFLVPIKDKDALAEAIHKLLENKEMALSMGRAGRQRVEDEFVMQKLLPRQMELYQQVIESALRRTNTDQ